MELQELKLAQAHTELNLILNDTKGCATII